MKECGGGAGYRLGDRPDETDLFDRSGGGARSRLADDRLGDLPESSLVRQSYSVAAV